MPQGMPPQGMPPQGMPPQGQQGKSISEFTAAQRITGKEALLVNQDITAADADENAVLAEQGADVTLQQVRLSRRGIRPVKTAVILMVRMPSSSFPTVRRLLRMLPSPLMPKGPMPSLRREKMQSSLSKTLRLTPKAIRPAASTRRTVVRSRENVDITTAGAHCAALATDRVKAMSTLRAVLFRRAGKAVRSSIRRAISFSRRAMASPKAAKLPASKGKIQSS